MSFLFKHLIMTSFIVLYFIYCHVLFACRVYGKKRMEEIISIPEVMFHPSRMRKRQFLDEILSSLTTEPLQEVDLSVSEAVSVISIMYFINFR